MIHFSSLLGGFFLDQLLGDPQHWPHPVRYIGQLISFGEKKIRPLCKTDKALRQGGRLLVLLTLWVTLSVSAGMLYLAFRVHPALGFALELWLSFRILALKSLKKESMRVYADLQRQDLAAARSSLSMIVGRDTQELDPPAITRAAVETVAENTSDGVIAPMLFLAIGGPVLGFCYKAINTLDSMVGYKNDSYLNLGRAAARLDDAVNFIPARLSALFMLCAAAFLKPASPKHYNPGSAWRIFRRDRHKHTSPNAGQTEAVCAGALGLRLGGPSRYFGRMVEKPSIGDDLRAAEPEDILRANRLAFVASLICLAFCGTARICIWACFS